ncbi:hypothetical protein KKG71_01100 [Patescibacteria group bacterium]|nr:hypothetical protein [Patescibacteria group bacterium]
MNKKNILLIIFLALFLVPELLWSPVTNIILGLRVNYIFRDTAFLSFSSSTILLIYVIQIIGAIGSSIFLFKVSKIFSEKTRSLLVLLGVVFILISILSVFALFLSLLSSNLVLF